MSVSEYMVSPATTHGDGVPPPVGHVESEEQACGTDLRDDPRACITAAEQQLLAEWNATEAPFPRNRCIHHLFEQQVERTPEAVAIVYQDEQLTYCELNRHANQLARYLQKEGVGPEVLVGLCMQRSIDMIVGLLAILKAGGAYVPLDPGYPKDRLAFLIHDARPPVLLTEEGLRQNLPDYNGTVICMDTQRDIVAGEEPHNLNTNVGPDHIVYVIYTSGSTGSPKGILIRHRSLVNYTLYACRTYGIGAGERVLQFASINFDASAEEIYPCLSSGATLVLRTEAMITSMAIFLELCRAWNITVLDVPTAFWHELVLSIVEDSLVLPSSVRAIVIGGERALPERLSAWQHHVGRQVRLFNTYGPTETTIVVTVADLTSVAQDEQPQREVSIGRPIANTQIHILDSALQPVPIGAPGEMYVGGEGLARGYLHRPDLTAERFIVHPQYSDAGTYLYKTGDLARYRPNGEIEFLGRADNQVKIRGFRIELEEIELALRQHAAIRDAVVLAREDTPGDKRLVAYVTTRQEHTCTSRDLRRYLDERLPAYMIPTSYMLLDTLPLTPSGKIDRRALPSPTATRESDADYVAPTSLLHHQLLRIWQDLLHIEQISITDNFLYLGGHSLLAARMVARIEQVCGKKLALTRLFAGPTIAQIAEALQSDEESRPRTPVVAVQRNGSRRPFFFLHGDPTGGAFYCFQLARSLGPDQPFYVLEPYRFDDLPIPPTLETMAAAHIEALRSVQPDGPYILGGWCDGGLMAYEIARQLHAQGQEVDLLVLMDPAVDSRFSVLLHGAIRRGSRILHLRDDTQVDWFLRVLHMYEAIRLLPRRRQEAKQREEIDDIQMKIPYSKYGFAVSLLKLLFPSRETLHQNYRNLYAWASLEYTIGPYPGKVAMIWAREERFTGVWQRKATQEPWIDLHFTSGTHMTCRTEHLPELCDHFHRIVQAVQGSRKSEHIERAI